MFGASWNEMEWNVIWPVFTLALGWLLGELSGIIKSSHGRREELRVVTFRLITLLDDLELFHYLCNEMPDDIVEAGSVQKAEDLRREMFSRWRNQGKLVQDNMDAVIIPIARFDPSLAHGIHDSLVTLRSLSKSMIGEGVLTGAEILAFNAMRQYVSGQLKSEIKTIARRLARKAGPLTAWRVRRLLVGRSGTEGLHSAGQVMTEMKDSLARQVEHLGIKLD